LSNIFFLDIEDDAKVRKLTKENNSLQRGSVYLNQEVEVPTHKNYFQEWQRYVFLQQIGYLYWMNDFILPSVFRKKFCFGEIKCS
jgi:hypothetical protein